MNCKLKRRLLNCLILVIASIVPTISAGEESLAEQAMKTYRQHQNFVTCGDSMYSVRTYTILQRMNVRFRIKQAYPLTEVDRMNKIEWKGTLAISFKAGREYDTNITNKWSEWYEDVSNESHYVYKQKGEWIVKQSDFDGWTTRTIKCSEIPPDK